VVLLDGAIIPSIAARLVTRCRQNLVIRQRGEHAAAGFGQRGLLVML
jgi:hypothetical protein